MSEFIRYANSLNNVSFDIFTDTEQNILFTLIFLVRGENKFRISFTSLKRLMIRRIYGKKLHSLLRNFEGKFSQLYKRNIYIFDDFFIDWETKHLEITIGEKTSYLYNDLHNNYTTFRLEEFLVLVSGYSKTLYRVLRQWESVRKKEFKIEDFREILSIPPKYRISEIHKIVLKQIKKELPKFFPNLTITTTKKYGRIVSITFSWDMKEELRKERENKVINISEALSNSIERTKRNRFIQPLLTPFNIRNLIRRFGDNRDLIKGLDFARKGINKEIFTLNYLLKAISSSINHNNVQLVVKKEDPKKKEDK